MPATDHSMLVCQDPSGSLDLGLETARVCRMGSCRLDIQPEDELGKWYSPSGTPPEDDPGKAFALDGCPYCNIRPGALGLARVLS